MLAVVAPQPDGAEELALVERRVPRPGPDEVLIKVAAAGINRPDILQRRGLYPPPPGAPDILGLEIAGEVVEAGEGAAELLGQPLCALVAGGGYAEYCVAPVGTCLPVPEAITLVEAAAMPETLFTVWVNVFERGFAADGDWVLVHGGTSGIGTMAIALGRLFGLQVIVTCGTDEKCAAALELGRRGGGQLPDAAISSRRCCRLTDGKGVAVVLDMVGGDYVPRNLACLAMRAATCRSPCSAARRPRSRSSTADAPAADADRLDAAAALGRVQDDGRRRDRQDRVALCRGRPAEAGDRQRLPAEPTRPRRMPEWKPVSMSARSCWRSDE